MVQIRVSRYVCSLPPSAVGNFHDSMVHLDEASHVGKQHRTEQ